MWEKVAFALASDGRILRSSATTSNPPIVDTAGIHVFRTANKTWMASQLGPAELLTLKCGKSDISDFP